MNEYKPGQRYLVTNALLENGNIIEITSIEGRTAYYKTIKGKPNHYNRFDFGSVFGMNLKPVEVKEEEITITRHGDKVVAKFGKKVGVAKCSPDDTFDFAVGAKLAFSRLMGEPEDKPKPKQEFKVGEFVRVIGNSRPTHYFPIGSIVGIMDVYKTTGKVSCYGLSFCHGEYSFSKQVINNNDLEHLPENTHAD